MDRIKTVHLRETEWKEEKHAGHFCWVRRRFR